LSGGKWRESHGEMATADKKWAADPRVCMKLPKRLSLTFLGILKASLNRNSVEQAGRKGSAQIDVVFIQQDLFRGFKIPGYQTLSFCGSITTALLRHIEKEKAGLRSSVCAPSSVTTLLVNEKEGLYARTLI
jgi:hypothetical protein